MSTQWHSNPLVLSLYLPWSFSTFCGHHPRVTSPHSTFARCHLTRSVLQKCAICMQGVGGGVGATGKGEERLNVQTAIERRMKLGQAWSPWNQTISVPSPLSFLHPFVYQFLQGTYLLSIIHFHVTARYVTYTQRSRKQSGCCCILPWRSMVMIEAGEGGKFNWETVLVEKGWGVDGVGLTAELLGLLGW